MAHRDDQQPSLSGLLIERLPDPGSISQRYVRQAIDDAEPHYAWCWGVITLIKSGSVEPDGGEKIIRFQWRLLEGLRPVEAAYFAVKREEKRLVRNKARYNTGWFRRRMSKLSVYCKTLLDAIAIGRALGNGFAWLFYERDHALIRQHLREPRQPLLPTGVGGVGERLVPLAGRG
jgi:hypothetical protein